MKEINLKQNFIIELNYKFLNNYIGYLLEKNYKEIENNDCNDEIILRTFKYYKDSPVALDLLGKILSNIQYSLSVIVCDTDDNNYPMKAEYIYDECDAQPYLHEDEEYFPDEFCKIRNQCMVEAQKQVKYYKEYFTRLYDRSRTIK